MKKSTPKKKTPPAIAARFVPVRKVILPTLKHDDNQVVTIKFLDAMRKRGDSETKVARVLELVGGHEMEYAVHDAVAEALGKEYPLDAYKGLCFTILKLPAAPGKRHKQFDITEVKDNGP